MIHEIATGLTPPVCFVTRFGPPVSRGGSFRLGATDRSGSFLINGYDGSVHVIHFPILKAPPRFSQEGCSSISARYLSGLGSRRPRRCSCGMSPTTPLVGAVVDALVASGVRLQPDVGPEFVGVDRLGLVVHGAPHEVLDGVLPDVRDALDTDLAAPLDRPATHVLFPKVFLRPFTRPPTRCSPARPVRRRRDRPDALPDLLARRPRFARPVPDRYTDRATALQHRSPMSGYLSEYKSPIRAANRVAPGGQGE